MPSRSGDLLIDAGDLAQNQLPLVLRVFAGQRSVMFVGENLFVIEPERLEMPRSQPETVRRSDEGHS